MSRSTAVLLGLAALSLVASGCAADATAPSPGSPTSSAPTEPAPEVEYVALGDSYAAAPGVPVTTDAGGCARSSGNYAHLVAAAADLSLTDVTCSGASTRDVLEQQVPALGPSTDLVTVGIGANDFGLFGLVLERCLEVSDRDPTGSPCTDQTPAEVGDVTVEIGTNIGALLDAVVAAAPEAQVVVVGYPDLLPSSGSCPDRIPLAAGDYALVDTLNRDLSDTLRAQAEQRDLTFVDVYAASQGHDICSAEPWVNGADVAPDGTIAYHPLAAEQAAVAALIGDVSVGRPITS